MVPPSGKLTLEMRRMLPVAPLVVFAAFTDPEKPRQVVGAGGLHCPAPRGSIRTSEPATGSRWRRPTATPSISPGSSEKSIPRASSYLRSFTRTRVPTMSNAGGAVVSGSRRVDEDRVLPRPVQDGGTSRASPGWLDGQLRQARAIHLEAITMLGTPPPHRPVLRPRASQRSVALNAGDAPDPCPADTG